MRTLRRLLVLASILLIGPLNATAQQPDEKTPFPISVMPYAYRGQRMGHVFWTYLRQRIRESPDFTIVRQGPRFVLRIHTTNDNLNQSTSYACVLTLHRADEMEIYIGSWLDWCPTNSGEQCSYEMLDEIREQVARFEEEMSEMRPKVRNFF